MTNDRINICFSDDSRNHRLCNTLSSPWYEPSWDTIPSHIESLYEAVVVAYYWYGYKRMDGSSSCAS